LADEIWTIRRVLAWTSDRLGAHGSPSARLDAELLLCDALGGDRLSLYTSLDKPLHADELGRIRERVRRRLSGEPVAYITGKKEFWSLPLAVDRRVLVPRPETERLVEVALELLDRGPVGSIVDVGTGSGAIALALKKERPDRRVLAVDASADALAVAKSNAQTLGLEVELLQGHLLSPVPPNEQVALVVANLPYVPNAERATLEVARHEPHQALFGGETGLELMAELCRQAPDRIAQGGALALEMGDGQAPAVTEMVRRAGFVDVGTARDLAGIVRIVYGRKASSAS
jgi:release factor glutamine methyltransferase